MTEITKGRTPEELDKIGRGQRERGAKANRSQGQSPPAVSRGRKPDRGRDREQFSPAVRKANADPEPCETVTIPAQTAPLFGTERGGKADRKINPGVKPAPNRRANTTSNGTVEAADNDPPRSGHGISSREAGR